MLCPTANVTGKLMPVTVNSELVLASDVIVTGEPVAVRIPVVVTLLPTLMLPKLYVDGASVNCPAAPPVPDSGKAEFESDALRLWSPFKIRIAMETSPASEPAETGAKVTLKDAVCPGERLSGHTIPVTLKPGPTTRSCSIAILFPELLVIVTDCVSLEPTFTVPKPRDVGLSATWAVAECERRKSPKLKQKGRKLRRLKIFTAHTFSCARRARNGGIGAATLQRLACTGNSLN